MKMSLGNAAVFLAENLPGFLKTALIIYAASFLVLKFGVYVFASQQNSQLTDISLTPTEEFQVQTRELAETQEVRPKPFSNGIFIPGLQVQAPIIEVSGVSNSDFVGPLKKGVALYPLSKPGQPGRTVVLGHSAPPNWPNINYDQVFSNLGDISEGDEIKIFYQGQEYAFAVKKKIILKKGQELPPPDGSHELVLITCWPPGIDYQRLAVFANLKGAVIE